jgi:hypothetical protein
MHLEPARSLRKTDWLVHGLPRPKPRQKKVSVGRFLDVACMLNSDTMDQGTVCRTAYLNAKSAACVTGIE